MLSSIFNAFNGYSYSVVVTNGFLSPPHMVDTVPVDKASLLIEELSESAMNTSELLPETTKH